MWRVNIREQSDGHHGGNAGDRGIVDCDILQRRNVHQTDTRDIGDGGILLGANRSGSARVDPGAVGADEIGLGCRREIPDDVERVHQRGVVAMIDQDILTAVEDSIAADGHLRVTVEIILDIADNIDGQITQYGHSSAVAGDIESTRQSAVGECDRAAICVESIRGQAVQCEQTCRIG